MTALHWPALVTLAALTLCFATAAIVGKARVRYGIKAPATSGHELFERAYRLQMSTLENTVTFLPSPGGSLVTTASGNSRCSNAGSSSRRSSARRGSPASAGPCACSANRRGKGYGRRW